MSVDNQPIFQEGLRNITATEKDLSLVAQVTSGEEAIEEFRKCRPDITLMNRRLPGIGGIAALVEIRKEFPKARIIVIASSGRGEDIHAALV